MGRIEEELQLPFPSRGDAGLDTLARSWARKAADAVYKQIVREKIAVEKRRPDGRASEEIRPIRCEVSVGPRTHGSALFTRGQTQALTLATLGTAKEEQRIDDLLARHDEALHPPLQLPALLGRRDGLHARPEAPRHRPRRARRARARAGACPSSEAFPYTMRLVSEILESNGSSSMASVCGSTLALMDAGVPIKAPVAGIAMGLIIEGDESVVLTDIQGAEDHLGDMDFKVAGTDDGITALQMDIKITGVTRDHAAPGARAGARGAGSTSSARWPRRWPRRATELSRVRAAGSSRSRSTPTRSARIIGKGGETIRGLEEEFECKIDIEEDGFVRIYASSGANGENCRARIEEMTRPISVGDVYQGKRVVKTADFGAFIELRKGTDGLLHASRVAPGVRIDSVEQVFTKGDIVAVEVTEIDKERGRIALKLVSKTEGDTELTPEQIGARYKEQYPNAGQRPEGGPPRDRGGRPRPQPRPAPRRRRRPRGLRAGRTAQEMRAGALNVALAGPEGAPALVLLHGLGASWQAWSAAIEHLAHRLRVVAVDLPGFGRSPELPGGRFSPRRGRRRRWRRRSTSSAWASTPWRATRWAAAWRSPTRPSARSACGVWRWSRPRA